MADHGIEPNASADNNAGPQAELGYFAHGRISHGSGSSNVVLIFGHWACLDGRGFCEDRINGRSERFNYENDYQVRRTGLAGNWPRKSSAVVAFGPDKHSIRESRRRYASPSDFVHRDFFHPSSAGH
jgi:hypothetical protein